MSPKQLGTIPLSPCYRWPRGRSPAVHLASTKRRQDARVRRNGAAQGPASDLAVVYQRGISLAVDDINAKGGVDGWKLKAILVDHKARHSAARRP